MLNDIELEPKVWLKYFNYKIDIICNDPKRWLGYNKRELPSYEYFVRHCIQDKGGKYDFTKRRYGNVSKYIGGKDIVLNRRRYSDFPTVQSITIKYSIWMGTPFNFKEEIINNK